MSDTAKSTTPGASGETSMFTERELNFLSWGMMSLKSGPPDIDYEKLARFAGMTNPRSASNAWTPIKKKLLAFSDGTVPLTPKKGVGRKKKIDGEDGEATPKTATPRKRANKDPEDGDDSPKKKGRTHKPKPKPKQEPEDEDSKVEVDSDSANDDDAEGEEV